MVKVQSEPAATQAAPAEDQTVNQQPDALQTFEAWWATFAAKFNPRPWLKQAMELHMKAAGHWDKRAWVEGARHFGFQV